MAPTTETLTAERILEATEEVLRRHGPAKATVVDVARALGVSHGSVYRHFRTKAALREAVTKRWLDRTSEQLSGIVAGDGDPEARLRDWLGALFAAKRLKAGEDPELFATYLVLAEENGEAVAAHVADLTGQLTRIVEAGVKAGTFAPPADPATTARALFQATGPFHNPGFAREWEKPGAEADFTALVDLLMRGLRAR
ncbi:TetR family transcriptional regulator [Streptomyces sp. NPDC052682]|uniref:TetR family transcriptional regulator n=1 Tax=Streptomyces sp. NPDC052682 TaxID=3154954 RepID=UPI00341C06C9